MLAKVLHDWDDEPARQILRNVRAAAPAGSRLLVLDSGLAGPNEPDDARWVYLVMLALVRGRERTEAEWRLLLAESGFEVEHVREDLVQAFARA